MILPCNKLFKLFAGMSFIIHILFIMKDEIFPTETYTRYEHRNLDDIEFPVVIKICIQPAFDGDEIRKVGYKEVYHYFIGESKYDRRRFGWAGHQQNGSVFSTVEGRVFLFMKTFLNVDTSCHFTM